MKISELLITESEMLLESYRDFKRVWDEALQHPFIPDYVKADLGKVPSKLEMVLRDQLGRSIISKDTSSSYRNLGINNPLDASSWVGGLQRTLKTDTPFSVLTMFSHMVRGIEGAIEETIASRTPKYKTIAKTPDYIVFDVENYAGAKKLRNQVRATWCIGADATLFDQYGKDVNNKTIIVFFLKKKEGMVFHVGRNERITSHDNTREWRVRGSDAKSSRGFVPIRDELEQYISGDKVGKLIKDVGMNFDAPIVPKNSTSLAKKDLELSWEAWD